MAWYRTGTVGVTNGSTTVTLSGGGNALQNIFPGDTFWGPDGKPYEIASITSASQFTLATNYQGSTATGQSYAIQPTGATGALRQLNESVSTLVSNYQTGRDSWAAAPTGTIKGRKSSGSGAVENLSPADALGVLTSGANAGALAGDEVLPALQGGGASKITSLQLVKDILALPGQLFSVYGGWLVGKSSPGLANQGCELSAAGTGYLTSSGTQALTLNRLDGDGVLAQFRRASVAVGSISVTASNTTYNTTSDYRLAWKAGHTPITNSGEFIDALNPRYFPIVGHAGFIAHEFQEVSPSSVTGDKDAVDESGDPIYQAMQASSPDVMANIVAELQSLRRRVAALEAAAEPAE